MTVKQNGGRRLGAGRKKAQHTIATEKAREYLIKEIAKNLEPIITAQIEAAKGISHIGKQGRIYTELPNTKVGEYLLNQVAGKAAMSVEVQGKEEQPFIIVIDT
ncbi:hypothetical protein EPO56_03610 [Patescibacteria group bacterium]|nr:MAG: hypothetical protein EPO56_03610 [Patescibacteria group bacterium]